MKELIQKRDKDAFNSIKKPIWENRKKKTDSHEGWLALL